MPLRLPQPAANEAVGTLGSELSEAPSTIFCLTQHGIWVDFRHAFNSAPLVASVTMNFS
jgi:hypothetical protein